MTAFWGLFQWLVMIVVGGGFVVLFIISLVQDRRRDRC